MDAPEALTFVRSLAMDPLAAAFDSAFSSCYAEFSASAAWGHPNGSLRPEGTYVIYGIVTTGTDADNLGQRRLSIDDSSGTHAT